MKIYSDSRSGNCDKVLFVVNYLELSYELIMLDSLKGETKTPSFLKKNPMGQIPYLEIKTGVGIAQSNAIIRYLANASDLIPEDKILEAQMDSWMFWEANNYEFFIAGCIGHMTYMGQTKDTRDPMRVHRAEKALDIMEAHLQNRSWFVGDMVSVADASLLAYTRNAHLGGFEMQNWPTVQNWVERSQNVFRL